MAVVSGRLDKLPRKGVLPMWRFQIFRPARQIGPVVCALVLAACGGGGGGSSSNTGTPAAATKEIPLGISLTAGNAREPVDTTAADSIGEVIGLSVDSSGNIAVLKRVAPSGAYKIVKFTVDGVQQPFGPGGSGVDLPAANLVSLASDAAGNLYESDAYLTNPFTLAPDGGIIRKISASGEVSTVMEWKNNSANSLTPALTTVGPDGAFYFVDLGSGNLVRWTVASGATVLANVGGPGLANGSVVSLTVDGAGTVYLLQRDGATFDTRKVSKVANGAVVQIAGPFGFSPFVTSLVADKAGNLYFGEGSLVRKISPTGQVSVAAGQPNSMGLVPGPLPGSLGAVKLMAMGSDGVLHLISSNALVKIRFQ